MLNDVNLMHKERGLKMSIINISVITPSIRQKGLDLLDKSLKRQTFSSFEWLICSPEDYGFGKWIKDLGKNDNDFYSLNKAYNLAIKKAKGELIISYQDMIEIKPDCLERFWEHYQNNKKIIVGAIGDQYLSFDPPVRVWADTRRRTEFGSFYECVPDDVEYTLASIPKQAIYDAGGFDEYFDHFPAISEKELNWRMDKLGYKFYLDQSIEYRAIKHPRLTKDWDEKYKDGCEYYKNCYINIMKGNRLKLDFLD